MEHFWVQFSKPDNVPLPILLIMTVVYMFMSFRQAFRNDKIIARLEANPALAEAPPQMEALPQELGQAPACVALPAAH